MIWTTWALACEALAPARLEARLTEAGAQLQEQKLDTFQSVVQSLEADLPCLAAPATAEQIQRYRVYLGIDRYMRDERDAAAAEFLAARSIASGISLPVYPEGHDIFTVFTQLDPVRARRVRLFPPRRGDLLLDGVPTRDRVIDAPVLVTVQRDDGEVAVQSLGAGTIPDYRIRQPQRVPLIAATSALAVTSAILLAQVPGTLSAFEDPSKTEAQLSALRTRNNAAWVGGVTTGVLALGSGAATVWFWDRRP